MTEGGSVWGEDGWAVQPGEGDSSTSAARTGRKAEFSGGAGTTVVVPRGSYHTFVTATGGRLNRTARQSFITRG
jgi:hypothetical protein